MKGLFKFTRPSQATSKATHQKVSLFTNFNACPLGLALARVLSVSQDSRVIVVSSNAGEALENVGDLQCTPFTAQLSKEADRSRLIAYLKAEDMKITRLIHNQPFMLKPTPKENRIEEAEEEGVEPSLREQQKRLKRVDELKDKIRELVETSLFVNAELMKHELLEDEARILQVIQKQHGIYGLLRASQVNLRKCL